MATSPTTLEDPPKIEPKNTHNGPAILVVDDSADNRRVLTRTLENAGYGVFQASNGEEAIATATAHRPQLILLDIMMGPGIDGFETLEQLKADEKTSDSAVIFLSSLSDTHDKVKGLELGAVDYISKPFQAEEVVARVKSHLTIIQLRRDLAERNSALEDRNRRMREDLEAAGRVQRALLPTSLPDAESFQFAWEYQPSAQLGGDSLDVFQLDERHIGMYVVDVSGHGVPASLLAVTINRVLTPRDDRACLVMTPGRKGQGPRLSRPADVARRLNVMFPFDERNPFFFTMFYGILDIETGTLRFVSAGHPAPLLARPDAEVEAIGETSPPIGALDDVVYEENQVELGPADRLLVHSDGVNEQANDAGERFGTERIRAKLRDCEAGDVCREILASVDEWAGGNAPTDDISLLLVGRRP